MWSGTKTVIWDAEGERLFRVNDDGLPNSELCTY